MMIKRRLLKLRKTNKSSSKFLNRSKSEFSYKDRVNSLETNNFWSCRLNKSDQIMEQSQQKMMEVEIQKTTKKQKTYFSKSIEKVKNKIRKIKSLWNGKTQSVCPVFKLIGRDDACFFELHDLSFKGFSMDKDQKEEEKESAENSNSHEGAEIETSGDEKSNLYSIFGE